MTTTASPEEGGPSFVAERGGVRFVSPPETALVETGGIAAPVMPAYDMLSALAGNERPLMTSFPRLCFGHLQGAPAPAKGLAVSCVRCRQSVMAKKLRPYVQTHCDECGHRLVPKGTPKPKKVWEWVRFKERQP